MSDLVGQLAAEHKHFRVVPDACWQAPDYCYTCRETWPCLVQRIADENVKLRAALEDVGNRRTAFASPFNEIEGI